MRFRRVLLLFWTALILLVVVPWASFQDHAHWQRVAWIPFVTPPVRVGDIVRNVLLYLPFGYLHASKDRRLWRTGMLALLLSLATELTQVFSHGRFPSSTDVTCNVGGACWGAWWAQRHHARAHAAERTMQRGRA